MKEGGGGQQFNIGFNGKTYLKASSWKLALWMEIYFGSRANFIQYMYIQYYTPFLLV
jgi:hypothetical protein